jgi:hypothetical protein
MTNSEAGGSDAETDLEAAINARLGSLDSGNYRANNDLVLILSDTSEATV